MDTKEFKAWFEGFCESIETTPTPEQWAKVKAKIEGLEPVKLTIPSFPIPRSPEPIRSYWQDPVMAGIKTISHNG